MKIRHALAGAVTVSFLAGCGGGGSDSVEEFVDACTGSSNMGDEICECVGERAREELSPEGFEFLVASLAGDEAKTEELRGVLGVDELMLTGTFMVRAPADCAGAGVGAGGG